jgi:hypothetical protein
MFLLAPKTAQPALRSAQKQKKGNGHNYWQGAGGWQRYLLPLPV